MDDKAYSETSVQNIADSIRGKIREYIPTADDKYLIADMNDAIETIRSTEYYKELILQNSIRNIWHRLNGELDYTITEADDIAPAIIFISHDDWKYALTFKSNIRVKASYYIPDRTNLTSSGTSNPYVNGIFFISPVRRTWQWVSDENMSYAGMGFPPYSPQPYETFTTQSANRKYDVLFTSTEGASATGASLSTFNNLLLGMDTKFKIQGVDSTAENSGVLTGLYSRYTSISYLKDHPFSNPLKIFENIAIFNYHASDFDVVNNIKNAYIIKENNLFTLYFSFGNYYYGMMPWHLEYKDGAIKVVLEVQATGVSPMVMMTTFTPEYVNTSTAGKVYSTVLDEGNISLTNVEATHDFGITSSDDFNKIIFNTQDIVDDDNNVVIAANITLDEIKTELSRLYPYFNT